MSLCEAHIYFFSPCPPHPVLAELHNADLIATEERERLNTVSDVVRVQRGKSLTKVAKTAEVLRTHGFEEESVFFAG